MLTFGQPLALWAALALALPVLAHMAFRQVSERFQFPSLRFIRAARIPRTGRKTPTDLPLLLLRVLFFLALASLLADPYWKEPSSARASAAGTETILALDLSPSMSGWGGLEEAKILADDLLGEDGLGRVGYLGFGSSVVKEIPPGDDSASVRAALAAAETDFGRGNPQAALDRAVRMFSSGEGVKRLVLLSDFQRSDWQTAYRRLDEAGVTVDLRPVGHSRKVGGKREGNLSLAQARAVPAGLGKVRAWTVVRNSSDSPAEATLRIEAGGETREEKNLVVPANSAVQAQFVLPEGDFASAVLALNGEDEFAGDDRRHLWLKAPPPRRFGFWASEDESLEGAEEREFLRVAVESAGDNGWNRWEFAQDNADGLRAGDESAELDLLVVSGFGSWFNDQELSGFATNFLKRGGSLIVTPSEPFAASVAALNASGLLELGFTRVVGGAGAVRDPIRIAALEPGSHLARTFTGKSARDLYLSSIYRHGLVKPVPEDKTLSVLLRSTAENPLVVLRSAEGEGRLLYFPYRLNSRWTDLPMRNSYLPLLMELVHGPEGARDRSWPRLLPGENLVAGEETFRAEEPGVFRFKDNFVEVILPDSESAPEVYDPSEISQSFGTGAASAKRAEKVETAEEEGGESLWLWFAIAAAALFVVENLWSRPRAIVNPHASVTSATETRHA